MVVGRAGFSGCRARCEQGVSLGVVSCGRAVQERLDGAALAFKAERAKMAEDEIIAMEVCAGCVLGGYSGGVHSRGWGVWGGGGRGVGEGVLWVGGCGCGGY